MSRSVIHISKDTLKLFKQGNELNINGIEHRLTKAEKLAFLAYSAKVVKFDTEEGWTTAINNSEIARICDLDVSTVISSKNKLNELNLIEIDTLNRFSYRVKIVGYEKLHLTKEENGTGYVKIAYNMFKSLCKLNSNELRLAFDLLVSIDNNKGSKFNKSEFATKYYDKVKKYLPSYINCKKKVKEIFAKLDGLFDISLKEECVKAKEILKFTVSNYLDNTIKGNRKGIKRMLKNNNITFDSKDLTDLVQMSIEYGYTAIGKALMYIFTNSIANIDNLGALVRTLIKGSFRVELC